MIQIPYFQIEGKIGGNQAWMRDPWMYIGGCGALAACDLCISLHRSHGIELYPYDIRNLNRGDYRRFAMQMKRFLKPRPGGIDRTDVWIWGFMEYLVSIGKEQTVSLTGFSGDRTFWEAEEALREPLSDGIPVPYLNLRHRDRSFREYVWHWFMLTGLDENRGVQASTYGTQNWLDLKKLWDTGYEKRGGFVICRLK